MPLTRVQLETLLVGPDLKSGRRGRLCARVPLYDPAARVGSVPALAGPIAGALRFLGIQPADPLGPADADLASVPEFSTPALIDIADLLLLENVVGNWDRWNEKISLGAKDMGDFGAHLLELLKDRRAVCKLLYGYGQQAPSLGSTDLGFAASSSWCVE